MKEKHSLDDNYDGNFDSRIDVQNALTKSMKSNCARMARLSE